MTDDMPGGTPAETPAETPPDPPKSKRKAAETMPKDSDFPPEPQFYKVILSHPDLNGRVVFRSVSESRARAWVENHFPRGSEAYLEAPDGTMESYEAERQGEHGQDADSWASFDPSEFQPVSQVAPPGDTPWADKEG
jgi:hypothetical protein